MATIPLTVPSVGINADTGAAIYGWDHVVQCLRDMFRTRFGERLMREWYGSFVPAALGRNITREEVFPVIAAITSAIEQWEPRYRIVKVDLGGEIRDGELSISIQGVYRPRALLGDNTEAGSRSLTISVSRDTLILEA